MNKLDIKNLIIISVDDLRSDGIAANRNRKLLERYRLKNKLDTPILDRFLKNGVFFSQCITVAPYTTSAHASILTGKWPANHGVREYFKSGLKAPTIFEILKKEGYRTLFQTDFPSILGRSLGFSRGIDKYVVSDEKESLAWIKKNEDDKKACFFHFSNVHAPYGFSSFEKSRGDYYGKVKFLLKKYEVPAGKKRIKEKNSLANMEESFMERALKQAYRDVLEKMHAEKRYGEIMDLYVEGINYFERKRFKKFISRLKRMNVFENTLVVICGDHGERWDEGTRGHFGKSYIENVLSDEVIRVPLIFYYPGLKPALAERQVRTIDIVPSILSLIGAGFSAEKFDGRALLSPNHCGETYAFSECWNLGDVSAAASHIKKSIKRKRTGKADLGGYLDKISVRTDRWKIIRCYDGKGRTLEEKIYDIANGEKETVFRPKYHAGLATALDRYLMKSVKRGKAGGVSRSVIRRQLEVLGYNV